MKLFNKESNLDERQEQALLKIEHNGCWLVFWGLLAVMAAQLILYGFDVKALAGEWIVFIALDIYLGCACMKNGIWDRKLRPNFKTNLIISLVAGVISGIVIFFVSLHNWPGFPVGSIASGVFSGGFTFVLCLIALQITAAEFRKKQAKMEEESEEETLE